MSLVEFSVRTRAEVKDLVAVVVGAFSSSPWCVKIVDVASIDEAPGMVKMLKELRSREAPRREAIEIQAFEKLKTVARISNKLSKVETTVRSLILDPTNRARYNRLNDISGEICGAALHLPRPVRREITKVGNKVRRVGKKGNKTGGDIGMIDHLQALLPLLAGLQAMSARLVPEEPAPAAPAPAPAAPALLPEEAAPAAPALLPEEPAPAPPAPLQEEPAPAPPAPLQEEPAPAPPAPLPEEPAPAPPAPLPEEPAPVPPAPAPAQDD